jgi:hypothetical protein
LRATSVMNGSATSSHTQARTATAEAALLTG